MLGARGEFWFFREFDAFFVFLVDEDEQTFSFLQVHITRADKLLCVCNKNWGDRNMHLWLTCYFVRQRGRGCSPTDCSLSMLSEGYLIRSIKTTLKRGSRFAYCRAANAACMCRAPGNQCEWPLYSGPFGRMHWSDSNHAQITKSKTLYIDQKCDQIAIASAAAVVPLSCGAAEVEGTVCLFLHAAGQIQIVLSGLTKMSWICHSCSIHSHGKNKTRLG